MPARPTPHRKTLFIHRAARAKSSLTLDFLRRPTSKTTVRAHAASRAGSLTRRALISPSNSIQLWVGGPSRMAICYPQKPPQDYLTTSHELTKIAPGGGLVLRPFPFPSKVPVSNCPSCSKFPTQRRTETSCFHDGCRFHDPLPPSTFPLRPSHLHFRTSSHRRPILVSPASPTRVVSHALTLTLAPLTRRATSLPDSADSGTGSRNTTTPLRPRLPTGHGRDRTRRSFHYVDNMRRVGPRRAKVKVQACPTEEHERGLYTVAGHCVKGAGGARGLDCLFWRAESNVSARRRRSSRPLRCGSVLPATGARAPGRPLPSLESAGTVASGLERLGPRRSGTRTIVNPGRVGLHALFRYRCAQCGVGTMDELADEGSSHHLLLISPTAVRPFSPFAPPPSLRSLLSVRLQSNFQNTFSRDEHNFITRPRSRMPRLLSSSSKTMHTSRCARGGTFDAVDALVVGSHSITGPGLTTDGIVETVGPPPCPSYLLLHPKHPPKKIAIPSGLPHLIQIAILPRSCSRHGRHMLSAKLIPGIHLDERKGRAFQD